MAFEDEMAGLIADLLSELGTAITYTPDRGSGNPVSALAIRLETAVPEPVQQKYFGQIEVDPSVITDPKRLDLVTFADGSTYLINRVDRPLYRGFLLELHRR